MVDLPKGLGNVGNIKKRFSKASERREMWRSYLQDMYNFCIPNRETFNFHAPGQPKSHHLYDSTGTEALSTFVSVVTSVMTPSISKWMGYTAGTDVPEKQQKEVNIQLEKATEIFFNFLNHSDFQSQSNVSHQDMAISVGALIIEQGDDITEPLLKVTAIPLSELYLQPTSMSKIHTVFRKHKMQAEEVPLKFPEATIPVDLQKIIEKEGTAEVEIIDGCQVFNFKTKQYHQVVIWENDVIFVQDYGDSPPCVIYRWSKVAGETYGRGPADMAMADIRTINKVKEFTLKGAALTIAPPIMAASDGVFNPHTVVVHPGTTIPVASVNPAPIAKLDIGGDLRLGAFIIEDLKADIRKVFFADPLGDITDPVRTATEVRARIKEMIERRGANFGRLQSEFVFPLVERITSILVKAGKLPLIKVNGRDVTLKMESPLAAAEAAGDVDNLLLFINVMQQLPPEVALLGTKIEMVPDLLRRGLGLPEELAKSKEQIEEAAEILIQSAQQAAAPQGEPIGPEQV